MSNISYPETNFSGSSWAQPKIDLILHLHKSAFEMSKDQIINYKPSMEYRRFGKTDEMLSVITLGGMRYKHGWNEPRHELPADTIEQCKDTVLKSLEMGINHIETAYGYMKSEHLYGKVLNDELGLKRDSYHLMTKGEPKTADETRRLVEEQLKTLKTDYLDFYGWHGINNSERFDAALATNGAVEELLKMKEEGIIKHVGFSTHAPLDIIIKAIETDLFEFVNLHYYYFFQRNKAAVDLAESKDMGVFIISPNDKGGQLFKAPQKIKDIVAPLTPIQWNARFCLSNPSVHTLTMGIPTTTPFDELAGIFPLTVPLRGHDKEVKFKLDNQKLLDPFADYEGYDLEKDPSGINIPEVLRFRKLLKCYDMKEYGEYRYNSFENEGHWFPGFYPTEERLKLVDTSKFPKDIPVMDLMKETHAELYKPKEKKG